MNPNQEAFNICFGQETLVIDKFSNQYTWDAGRHCNAEYELHVILRGSCCAEVNDQQITLAENRLS